MGKCLRSCLTSCLPQIEGQLFVKNENGLTKFSDYARGLSLKLKWVHFQFEEKAQTYKVEEALETSKVYSPRHKVDQEDCGIKKNNNMDATEERERERSIRKRILVVRIYLSGSLQE